MPCGASLFLDVDVAELNQTGRPHPFSVAKRSMMLQRDLADRRQARQIRFVDDEFAVEYYTDCAPLHRDLERVPLADVLVGIYLRRYRRYYFRRHLRIGAIAVEFSRPDGPAPDVDLRLTGSAQENSRV